MFGTDAGTADGGIGDGGPRDGGRADAGRDGGEPDAAVDDTRPTIVATSPTEGASDVAPGGVITVTFSEAMAEGGTVTLRAGGVTIAAASAFASEVLTITPDAALPSSARVRVTIGDDFADLAGNTLALPYELTFDVADADAPAVASSEPAEGATDVSARIETITITFDEPMIATGNVSLTGGPGTVGTLRWIDGQTVTFPVTGLAHETAYALVLTGFTDAAANALDPVAYLGDGALSFATGADLDAPRVIDSSPAEGQVNVSLRGTPSVTVIFDEPMNEALGTATLVVGSESTVLPGTWSGTHLVLPISGRLRPDAMHAVRLEGFEDLAGNALDTVFYLHDGAIQFDTGADVTAPVVVYSTPNEASASADHHLAGIQIVFDRGMDTSATTALRVDDGVAPFDAPVTWNLAGTIATLDVAGRVHTGRTYQVDVRGVVDLTGQPIVASHPYLGDGRLDFGTRRPSGEQCRDEASIAEATSTLPSGGYEWVFPTGSLTIVDDVSCRYAGAPATTQRPDAVVRYVKTSASGSGGGRYLHVTVEGPGVGARTSLAVYRDECAGGTPEGLAARQTCLWDRYRWESYLDVGPGEYFVWGGQTGSATIGTLTIRIEEVDAVREGESCAAPFTTASAIHSLVGGEHVWDVPVDAYQAADMDGEFPGDGAAECDVDQVQGTDFVVEIDKAADDTLVNVVIEPSDLGSYYLDVEARTSCDPGAGGAALACRTDVRDGTSGRLGPQRITVRAPRGPLYVWVANSEQDNQSTAVRLRAEEIPSAPGTSCQNAIPLSPGANAITPTSSARLDPPSCFATTSSGDGHLDDGITWYRMTATQAATMFRADVPGAVDSTSSTLGAIAVIDAASGRELGCVRDATVVPLTALGAPGRDVCIAVREESGIGRIDVSSAAYAGIGMGAVTDLAILPPLNTTGGDVSITGDNWMTVTATTLYMAIGTGLVSASREGHVRADLRALTSAQIGTTGVSVGEAVWSLDDTATAGTTTRLIRVVDAAGGATTTAWDGAFPWPADAFDGLAYDGTSFLVANDGNAPTLRPTLRRFDPTTPGAPTTIGSLGSDLNELIGLAADATWIYFAGVRGTTPTVTRGIFRIRRADVGTGTPELIAPLKLTTGTGTTLVSRVAMAVDDLTTARVLYARDADGAVNAITDPGGTPTYVGVVSSLGDTGDFAMAIDRAIPALFLFETETVSTGRFVRVE